MFNRKIKQRYIDEKNEKCIMPVNYLNRQFSKTEVMENRLDKDVYDFNAYDIISFYKLQNACSLDVLIVTNSQLSMYTDWAIQNGLVKDNQNHFEELQVEKLAECVNKAIIQKKIITKEDIRSWLLQMPNARDQFVVLALFEGIKGKDFCEIARLREEDIDRENKTAKLYTGRVVKISDRLIEIIDECVNEYTYYSVSGQEAKTIQLIDNGYIFKDYPNVKENVSDFQFGRKIYNSITRTLKWFGVFEFMSANDIAESGKLNKINELAKENRITPIDVVYSDLIAEVEKQYNFKMVRSIFKLKYKDYLEA